MERVLLVDLSREKFAEREIRKEDARKFIGGSGLGAKIMSEFCDPRINPFSPENPLIFLSGPLTGTKAPACGRYVVCAKSPLTGGWGEANSGGFFGPWMRFAGYDVILILGRAKNLSYILIKDGKPELKNASELSGKDTYEAQKVIKEEEKDLRVACIGMAGENMVRYASIMNDDGRAAGRCGMGAVMGSKNLKAIAVSGERKPPIARKEEFEKVAKESHKTVKSTFYASMLSQLGTSGYMEMAENYGDLPVKYYTEGKFPSATKISGAAMSASILKRNARCYGCPIGCGRKIEIKEGKYKMGETDGPEYETLATLGALCMNENLEGICYANNLCNRYGMDTISCGISISFALFLYEKGFIKKEDVGFDLRWGDPDLIINLVGLIARREGFGNLLAEGVRILGEKYGADEYAAHVKGLEVPMHDPRAFFSLASEYATSPRGACHLQGQPYMVEIGFGVKELGFIPSDRFSNDGKGVLTARHQDWMAVYNSLVMCEFSLPRPKQIADLLSHVTGYDYSLEELMKAGERINNLKRIFNLRCGIGREQDRLPKIILQPLKNGGTRGNVPDLGRQLKEYYEYRKWDPETGKPKKEKLIELGLEDEA